MASEWCGWVSSSWARRRSCMKPAEGSLDHPAPPNDLKTLPGGGVAGDLDIDAEAGTVVDAPVR